MPVLPEFRLDGKVAFIAGEGEGESPVIAQALAEAGARVFMFAPRQPTVEGGMMSVAKIGGQCLGLFGDPSDPVAVEKGMAAFMPIFGRVDVLVNNSRVSFGKPFEEVSLTEWDEAVRKNLRSAYVLSHRIGKEFLKQGKGRIINVVSGLADRGQWNSTAFCATQSAMMGFTRGLALEWAKKGVRVNAVGVGWQEGQNTGAGASEDEKLVKYIPMRKRGRPEDIGALTAYLASDACEFVSGQAIYVDGGLMAHP
jgi:NAD(P)-dependent dehydrogenase (short-subunit alcohol dehydrogenase family)